MAWVNTQEGRTGRILDSTQLAGAGNTSETIRRVYTVLFDDPSDGMDSALVASGIPAIGDTDSALTQSKCNKKTVLELSPVLFEVAADFSGVESFLLAPYDRGWERASSTEEATEDAAGDALVNPVGDRYRDIMTETADQVYVVTRNESVFPEALSRTYFRAVSNDAYHGYLAGEGRMIGDITGRYVVDGLTHYWEVTYRIQFREGGWLRRHRIEGLYEFPAPGETKKRCQDGDGFPSVIPLPLDSDGKQLSVTEPLPADQFETFQLYTALSFVALGLG